MSEKQKARAFSYEKKKLVYDIGMNPFHSKIVSFRLILLGLLAALGLPRVGCAGIPQFISNIPPGHWV